MTSPNITLTYLTFGNCYIWLISISKTKFYHTKFTFFIINLISYDYCMAKAFSFVSNLYLNILLESILFVVKYAGEYLSWQLCMTRIVFPPVYTYSIFP